MRGGARVLACSFPGAGGAPSTSGPKDAAGTLRLLVLSFNRRRGAETRTERLQRRTQSASETSGAATGQLQLLMRLGRCSAVTLRSSWRSIPSALRGRLVPASSRRLLHGVPILLTDVRHVALVGATMAGALGSGRRHGGNARPSWMGWETWWGVAAGPASSTTARSRPGVVT